MSSNTKATITVDDLVTVLNDGTMTEAALDQLVKAGDVDEVVALRAKLAHRDAQKSESMGTIGFAHQVDKRKKGQYAGEEFSQLRIVWPNQNRWKAPSFEAERALQLAERIETDAAGFGAEIRKAVEQAKAWEPSEEARKARARRLAKS